MSNNEDAFVAVVEFVQQSLPRVAVGGIGRDTELIGNGLDSLAVLDFMNLMAEKFGVDLDDSDFSVDNFETVGNLVGLVERKCAA